MAAAVTAYVSQGRWVADCPRCPSAELVTPSQSAYQCPVLLGGCGTEFSVKMPGKWQEGWDLLMARPRPENRNWLLGESVKDLAAENKARL